MAQQEHRKSPNPLLLALWSSKSKLNTSLFALMLHELKSSHLETWTPGMLNHQGSGMHTLHLITSSLNPVKVADVTCLRKLEFVLRHCSCASLCVDISVGGKYQRVGQGWRIVLLAFMGSCECHWMLVLWDEWQSIPSCTPVFSSL